jgi:hypothetical protein
MNRSEGLGTLPRGGCFSQKGTVEGTMNLELAADVQERLAEAFWKLDNEITDETFKLAEAFKLAGQAGDLREFVLSHRKKFPFRVQPQTGDLRELILLYTMEWLRSKINLIAVEWIKLGLDEKEFRSQMDRVEWALSEEAVLRFRMCLHSAGDPGEGCRRYAEKEFQFTLAVQSRGWCRRNQSRALVMTRHRGIPRSLGFQRYAGLALPVALRKTKSDCISGTEEPGVDLWSRLSVILNDFHFLAAASDPLVNAVTNAIARAECTNRQDAKAERWDGETLWARWPKEFIKSIDTLDPEHTAPDGGYHGPRHWEHGRSCVEEIVGACGRALYEHFPTIHNLQRLRPTLRELTVLFSQDIYSHHLTHLDVLLDGWIAEAGQMLRDLDPDKEAAPNEEECREAFRKDLFTFFVLSRLLDVSERIENEGWELLRRISGTDKPHPSDQAPSTTGEPEAGGPASALAIPEAAITTTGKAAGDGQRSAEENVAALGVKSDATKQEDAKQRRDNARKGDATLLGEKLLIRFKTAEQYLGISERQRQKLISSGALKVEGQGQNRKITAESLKAYLPPEIPN